MQFVTGFWTKTYRLPDGTVTVVPGGVAYDTPEGAQEITGIRDIRIHFPLDGAVTAEIELLLAPTKALEGLKPVYSMIVDGEHRRIRSVELDDGSRWPE